MVNRKNQQLSESSKNKTEGNAGWDRRQIQKVKLLNLNSRPFVKGQLKDLNRRIGKLSGNPRRIFGLCFRSCPKHLWVFQRFFEVLEESLLFSGTAYLLTSPYWTSCSGRRKAGELLPALEVLRSSFWFRILLPEINTLKRHLPCWGKLRPCVEIAQTASW